MLSKSDLSSIEKVVDKKTTQVKFELKDEISDSKEVLRKDLHNFRDNIITLLDKALKELKTIREEQTIISGKLSEHSDTLEDHESRISKFEQTSLQAI